MQRPGGLRRVFSISYLLLKYTESSETHLLCGRKFYLVWMVGCAVCTDLGVDRFWEGVDGAAVRAICVPPYPIRPDRMGHPGGWWWVKGNPTSGAMELASDMGHPANRRSFDYALRVRSG